MKSKEKKIRIQHLVEFCECECHTRGTAWNKEYPCKKCVVTQQTNKQPEWNKIYNLVLEFIAYHEIYKSGAAGMEEQPDVYFTNRIKQFISQNYISKEELKEWINKNRAIFNLSDGGMEKIKDPLCPKEAGLIAVSDLLELIK